MDVNRRLAQAPKAFGALRKTVFMDRNLCLSNAYVLPVLLYGTECWIPLLRHNRKLNSFHHRCIRMILGISNNKQWSEHIIMTEVRRR